MADVAAVVAMIALAAAALVPALVEAREESRAARCGANLAAIGQAYNANALYGDGHVAFRRYPISDGLIALTPRPGLCVTAEWSLLPVRVPGSLLQ